MGYRICVIAGMIDAKLSSKIVPLQAIPEISRIDLIRRQKFNGEKIYCHTPPRIILRWKPLAELWRFATLIFLAIFRRPKAIIAFGTVPHGIYAWWIGRLFHIPVIQHVMGKNDLRLTFTNQSGKGITLRAVLAGDAIAVRGVRMQQWLTNQGVNNDHIFVQSNIHDFNLFTPGSQSNSSYDLVYAGLLEPYKRIDLMIEAVAAAKKELPSLKLLLIGAGSQRTHLEQIVRKLGIKDSVRFAGHQEFQALPGFFHDAKVFIMTSQGEGLPMAMIEAMSSGLPAIVPADADIEEVALNGKNSIVVFPSDKHTFSRAITDILTNKNLHTTLRKGALELREKFQQEYSLEHQTLLWRTHLSRIIKHN